MDDAIRRSIADSQSGFEKLVAGIPGKTCREQLAAKTLPDGRVTVTMPLFWVWTNVVFDCTKLGGERRLGP